MYKNPRMKTNIGLDWRSAVANHLNGQAAFSFLPGSTLPQFLPVNTTMNTLFPNQGIKGLFTEPASYTVGVSNSAFHNTTFEFDFELQDFRRFKDFPINFEKVSSSTATPAEQRLIFDFHNSYVFKLGMERKWNESTTVRLGYSFDASPVPDKSVNALFPDASRNSFTLGASRTHGNLEFSAYYQAMFFLDRVTNVAANANQYTNGDYSNFAHLLGLGLRFFPNGMGNGKQP